MTPLDRVTIAARVFCIAAILGLGLASRDPQLLLSLVIIATAAMTAVYLTISSPLAAAGVVAVESIVTGLVIGLALPTGVVFLPYLVVLTLIAGITRGVVGVSGVVLAQFLTISLTATVWAPEATFDQIHRIVSPWVLTGIGTGLLGTWLRETGKVPRSSVGEESYASAHRLLTQLRNVARRLTSGLDPLTIAAQIRDDVADALQAPAVEVLVCTEGGLLSPLVHHRDSGPDAPVLPQKFDCRRLLEPQIHPNSDGGTLVTLPLRVGSRTIGVVAVSLDAPPVAHHVKSLMPRLDSQSLRLDAALTFDEVRTLATVEERRRLAREIHDGVAQEVASLGYAVDELTATAESPDQRAALGSLRGELTRIVSELRLSIFDLRSEVLRETDLGTALSDYLREVGAKSTMTVHLSLDQGPTRLRPETEVELLRIAQEAITNARRHSQAQNLWVECQVKPPFARLEVRDDGHGLSGGREDSYGLRIMSERAERLDAQLAVESDLDPDGIPTGTVVRVTLDAPKNARPPMESEHLHVRV